MGLQGGFPETLETYRAYAPASNGGTTSDFTTGVLELQALEGDVKCLQILMCNPPFYTVAREPEPAL